VSYHPTASGEQHAPLEIASGTPDRASAVVVLADQVARTRDGVRLGADVYLPVPEQPVPAILLRQPYGRRTPGMGFPETARFFARKGYACVVQDVRGKFSSEGTFDPGVHEVADGTDTVEWVADQEWCDGRVGLWGESYYGFTAVAAAVGGHPAIRCIAPGDIGVDRRAAWFRGGAFALNTAGYWALAMDAQEYGDVTRIDPYHLPLAELGRPAGSTAATWPHSWRTPTTLAGGRPAGWRTGCTRCGCPCCRGAAGGTPTSAHSCTTTRCSSRRIRPRPRSTC